MDFETYIRPGRGFAAIPTNDDLTLLVIGWPIAEREANKTESRELPEALERARLRRSGSSATRVDRFYGAALPTSSAVRTDRLVPHVTPFTARTPSPPRVI
jgi:hypothetical protein